MKRLLLFAVLWPAAALAQFTTVSGTVTDPNGLPYAFGTIASTIVASNTPKFTASGNNYQQPSQATGLDSTGHFIVTLADNTLLTPGGSTWTFVVCSALGTVQPDFGKGPKCFTVTGVTISGSSQDIGATLRAAAPALTFTFSSATGALLVCSDTSGSPTAQNCTTSPSFTPSAGSCIAYLTTTQNTGALTLNVNSSGAAPVQKWLSTVLVAGDVPANRPVVACFDGTNWNVSTIGNVPAGTGTVTGTGTANTIAMWTSSTAVGNSPLTVQAGSNQITSTDLLAINPGPNNQPALRLGTTWQATNCLGGGSGVFQENPTCANATDANIMPGDATGYLSALYITNNIGVNLTSTPAFSAIHGLVSITANGSPGMIAGVIGVGGLDGGTGTQAKAGGVYGFLTDNQGGGATGQTITLGFGVGGNIQYNSSTNQAGQAAALLADSPSITGTGVFATGGGLLVKDQTVGGITTPYSIKTLGNAPNLFQGHLAQVATGNWAGTCAMSAGTTCTFSITSGYASTPIGVASVQSAAPTTFQGSCALSGTTVTITASAANSNTWACLLIGNPS